MSLFGAFPNGGFVRFELKIQSEVAPKFVSMELHADGWNKGFEVRRSTPLLIATDHPEEGEYVFFIDVDFDILLHDWGLSDSGLFYYHYVVDFENDYVELGGEDPIELSEIYNLVGERQLLVFRDDYKTSKNFRDGIIYHVFVDRFKRSGRCGVKDGAILNEDWDHGIPQYPEYPGAHLQNNMFFGGDLYGVIEKLDYIAGLGTKTIYLSPVFDAYSNHKYDGGDYLTIDSMFGGDEALSELCKAAAERGIEIILDGVFNHTGDNSVYFNKYGKYDSVGAYQSDESPFRSWYNFGATRDDYDSWWGIKILPRVNSSHPDFQNFITEFVVEKWMNMGVAGWRLDVADELSESFLVKFREAVKKKNPDGVIIGEVWEDATDKVSYGTRRAYLCGCELDSVMNYPLRSAIIEYVKWGNCEFLRHCTEGTYRRYPKCSSDNLMNFLGTHDTERIITILGGESSQGKSNAELAIMRMSAREREYAASKLRLAYSIIAGLPGVPCVFYGDEAGLEGYHDPFCRRTFPWNNINSTLLQHYRKIGQIRRDVDVFRDGLFKIISLTDSHIVYERTPYGEGNTKVIVAASRRGKLRLNFYGSVFAALAGCEVFGECVIGENEAEYFVCPAELEITKENLVL